jgi:hypothetical protein
MWTDACGNDHYEFWTGIKRNGKTYQSRLLYEVCNEFGDPAVIDACNALDLNPNDENLAPIYKECQRQEDSYV